MKIAYFTNFLFHHQYPLCEEMLNQPDVDFTFVCCEPLSEERISMGYEDLSNLPFVIRAYESAEAHQKALRIAEDADVVIFGSTKLEYLYRRMQLNKLTFRYCERSLRRGTWRVLIPTTARSIYNQYLRYRNKNLYILSASAYTSHDLSILGFDINKCFKWGYLPEVIKYDSLDNLIRGKQQNKIIWVGRFINCKHPEFALKALYELNKQGIKFSADFIGDGPLRSKCEEYVNRQMSDANIRFLGSMSPESVRRYMEEASIFIFNSDRYEGWGAVVGEAMNSGCAVLVSHACGSAPYLIEQNVNGRVYRYGDLHEFGTSLAEYLNSEHLVQFLGTHAYETMTNLWNVNVAVPRFLDIVKSLLNGLPIPEYKSGPCSKADYIANNWYRA